MRKLKKSTLTERVIAVLGKSIRSGEYIAGRKMPSTRELALGLGVSQRIVKLAIDDLESRDLVRCIERDGVYLNPDAVVEPSFEFFLLSLRRATYFDYPSMILSVGDQEVWGGINLAIRSIATDDKLSSPIMKYEMEKIKEGKPDCMALYMSATSPEDLEPLADLPFPVVLLGDLDWLPGPDFKFNQIVEDTAERAEAYFKTAESCGARDMLLIGGTLDRFYTRILKEACDKRSAEGRLACRYQELEASKCSSDAELRKTVRELVRSTMKGGAPAAIAIDGMPFINFFLEPLRELGLVLGRDIAVINDKELAPGTIYLESDYHAFSKAAVALMRGIAGNPAGHFGRKALGGLISRRPVVIGNAEAYRTRAAN